MGFQMESWTSKVQDRCNFFFKSSSIVWCQTAKLYSIGNVVIKVIISTLQFNPYVISLGTWENIFIKYFVYKKFIVNVYEH